MPKLQKMQKRDGLLRFWKILNRMLIPALRENWLKSFVGFVLKKLTFCTGDGSNNTFKK